jgi:hypothetical protein
MEAHGLNALNEFIQTILYSNSLKGAKPLSAIIIGLPDTGKTETIIQYSGSEGVFVASDITGYGVSTLLDQIAKKEIKCLVIPDISRVLEGRGGAGQTVISALNSVIEEGVHNIRTKFVTYDSGKEPVRVSLLAALTIASLNEKKKDWAELGFLSRVVPFYLNYTREDIEKSLDAILHQENVFEKKIVKFNGSVEVEITQKQKKMLQGMASFIARVNHDFTSFRSFKNLIYLAQSHAIYRKKTIVEFEDMQFVRALIPFWFLYSKNDEFGGNDCQFYIIKNLPNSMMKVFEELKTKYSEKTLLENFESLKTKGIIKSESDNWTTVY